MAERPDKAAATLLAAQVGELVQGDNLFYSSHVLPVSATIPARAVFVIASGGPTRVGRLNGETTGRRRPTVRVLVRGDKHDGDGAHDLAILVYEALHEAGGFATGYDDARCLQDSPLPLGVDKDLYPMLSVNAELWLVE